MPLLPLGNRRGVLCGHLQTPSHSRNFKTFSLFPRKETVRLFVVHKGFRFGIPRQFTPQSGGDTCEVAQVDFLNVRIDVRERKSAFLDAINHVLFMAIKFAEFLIDFFPFGNRQVVFFGETVLHLFVFIQDPCRRSRLAGGCSETGLEERKGRQMSKR